MKDQHVGTIARVKDKKKVKETAKNDLRIEKELGNILIYGLCLLGIVVGGFSLVALLSGLLQTFNN